VKQKLEKHPVSSALGKPEVRRYQVHHHHLLRCRCRCHCREGEQESLEREKTLVYYQKVYQETVLDNRKVLYCLQAMRTSWEEEEHLQQSPTCEAEHKVSIEFVKRLQQSPTASLQQSPTCEAEHLKQMQPILVSADETCWLHTNSLPTNSTNAPHVTADATYYIHQDITRGDSTAPSLDEAGLGLRA
jgi:hypothetical protein